VPLVYTGFRPRHPRDNRRKNCAQTADNSVAPNTRPCHAPCVGKSAKPRKIIAASTSGGGRRSPLFVWMRRHHADLSAAFSEAGPNWAALTLALGKEGLTDRTGKPPTIRTAQRTWYEVCKHIRRATTSDQGRTTLEDVSVVQPIATRSVSGPLRSSPSSPAPLPELPPLTDDRPRMPVPKKFRRLK
jgi:hypothetical protein